MNARKTPVKSDLKKYATISSAINPANYKAYLNPAAMKLPKSPLNEHRKSEQLLQRPGTGKSRTSAGLRESG